MPRKFERTAVLLALAVSPLWLPAIPDRWSSASRARIIEWLKPSLEAAQSIRQGFGAVFSGLWEWATVFEENHLLLSEVKTLIAHERTHQQLVLENDRLRRLLEFRERSPWRMVPAEVIGREIGPWSRSLLLDKGSRDGIREGMAVITPVGLVGRIGDAGPSTSRVLLLNDPHFRVAAVLLESRLFGLVAGGGVGACSLTYLPLDAQPKEAEAVLTAGGKSFCPDGIPIGTVRKLWTDRSQLFKTAGLQPAVDPSGVEEVLVVAWHPSEPDRSS